MEEFTRFEKTRLISARALQLSLGAPPMISVPKGASMIELATFEFEQKKLPLTILRKYPNGEEKRISVS
ncbi:MAG: DNA-directed RNA polymerase subunit K [archaeon]|nr:DNA-directed RNA polymerase subunit K [Candidatus Micrarchaeota archaeon]